MLFRSHPFQHDFVPSLTTSAHASPSKNSRALLLTSLHNTSSPVRALRTLSAPPHKREASMKRPLIHPAARRGRGTQNKESNTIPRPKTVAALLWSFSPRPVQELNRHTTTRNLRKFCFFFFSPPCQAPAREQQREEKKHMRKETVERTEPANQS